MRLDLLVLALSAALGASFAVARAAPAVEPGAAGSAEMPGLATSPIVSLRGPTSQASRDMWGSRHFDCGAVVLSLLLDRDQAWLGLSTGWRVHIGAADGAIDWALLEESLREVSTWPIMYGRADMELAVTDEVSYFTLLQALAVLHEAGLTWVSFGAPHQLASRLGPEEAGAHRR